jgi:hypothetical protein
LSHVPASTGSGIFVVCLVLALLVVFAAIAAQSWMAGALGAGLTVLAYVWLWQRSALVGASLEQSKHARTFRWAVAIYLLILSMLR